MTDLAELYRSGRTHYYGDSCAEGEAGRGGHFRHSGGIFTLAAGVGGPCCIEAREQECVCMEAYTCSEHGETHIGTHD